MALVKICDNCKRTLGGPVAFVQSKGSVSDQLEDGPNVSFKYLTDKPDETHTYCDDNCEMEWRDGQRRSKRFMTRL